MNPLLARCDVTLKAREAHSGRRRLTISAPGSIDFSSNDFLSLSTSKELRQAYLKELHDAGEFPLGSGGSRLLDGNSSYAEQLEHQIAIFHRAPAALLFNSGFDANSGFFSCVPQHGDVILYDAYIHASVHEGMRLSRASVKRHFAHNSVSDFENTLKGIIENNPAIIGGTHQILVAVESVYSMDGDVAPIKEILGIMNGLLPHRNGHLIVDEAHSTGVFGKNGRGLVCELGVEDQVLARLHTFGKALTSTGAALLCPPVLRDYLINYARSLIYTTALGIPSLAMAKTVYNFMSTGNTKQAQRRVWALIDYLQNRLCELPESAMLTVVRGPPKSPIFSVCTPWPRELARICQERGLVVRPIVPPTVPKGGERIRVCLHSGNTMEEIDKLITILEEWVRDEISQSNGDRVVLVVHPRI